jgi:hypothetical protein
MWHQNQTKCHGIELDASARKVGCIGQYAWGGDCSYLPVPPLGHPSTCSVGTGCSNVLGAENRNAGSVAWSVFAVTAKV